MARKERWVIGSLIKTGIERYEKRCELCGRKIYLYDDWKEDDHFICTECFFKTGGKDVTVTEETLKNIKKLLGIRVTREEVKEILKALKGVGAGG